MTDKLIREIVGTKIGDMVKTIIACSAGDSLEKNILQNYPYKYKQLEKKPWTPKQSRTLSENWQNISKNKDLEKFLRVLSGNNPDHAGFLIKLLLRSNKEIGNKFESDHNVPRVNSNIIQSIK